MGITDGQPVDAANSNPAWLDANADDQAQGKIDFVNTAGVSGPSILNIQRNMNAIFSYVGGAINQVYNYLPTWLSNIMGSSSDTIKARVESIDASFSGTTGHAHTGVDGQGPQISAAVLSNVPLQVFAQQGTDLTGVTGTSTDVSTPMSGKTPSSGIANEGVVVTAPDNWVVLTHATGLNTDDEIVDGLGNRVYGRITYLTGVWTLSYFVDLSGVETAYSFSSTNVRWVFPQLFNPLVNPPTYSNFSLWAKLPSENVTADVLDATSSVKGKVLLPTATPGDVAATGSVGTTNGTVANGDHVHKGVHSLGVLGDATKLFGDIDLEAGTNITLVRGSQKITVSLTLGSQFVEYHTLSGGEITAKQITLSGTPTVANKAVLDVIQGGPQAYTADFTVSGNVLGWSGLGLDGVLVAGDVLRIQYFGS